MGFSQVPLISLRKFLYFYFYFFEFFKLQKGVGFCQMLFYIFWDWLIMWFCPLCFIQLIWYITLIFLCWINLNTWNKSHLVMVYNSFYILLDSVSPCLNLAGVKRGGEPRPQVSLVTGVSQITSPAMYVEFLIFPGKSGGKISKNDWFELQGQPHAERNLGVNHQPFACISFLNSTISFYSRMDR